VWYKSWPIENLDPTLNVYQHPPSVLILLRKLLTTGYQNIVLVSTFKEQDIEEKTHSDLKTLMPSLATDTALTICKKLVSPAPASQQQWSQTEEHYGSLAESSPVP